MLFILFIMKKQTDKYPSIFAKKLVQLRKENQLTQAELAEKLHMSRSTIAKLEVYGENPNLKTIYRIADFFNVSPSLFVTEKSSEPLSPGPSSKTEELIKSLDNLSPSKQKMIVRMVEAAIENK
jgi:transcriptional regulator with XRE-family HTH domain